MISALLYALAAIVGLVLMPVALAFVVVVAFVLGHAALALSEWLFELSERPGWYWDPLFLLAWVPWSFGAIIVSTFERLLTEQDAHAPRRARS